MRGKRLGFSLEETRTMLDLYDTDPTQISQLQLFLNNLNARKKRLKERRDDIDLVLSKIAEREAQCEKLLKRKEEGN